MNHQCLHAQELMNFITESTRNILHNLDFLKPGIVVLILSTILIFSLPVYAEHQQAPNINLTSEEQQWIDSHPLIPICVDPKWMPFEQISKDGKYEGMVSEYIELISKRLGVSFQLYKTDI